MPTHAGNVRQAEIMHRSPGSRAALIAFTALVALLAVAAVVAVAVRSGTDDPPAPTPIPQPGVPPTGSPAASPWSPSTPAPADDVRLAWAYLDSTDGTVRAGGHTDLHELDHLVVPALAQDYLDQGEFTTDRPPSPDVSDRLHRALAGEGMHIDWLYRQGDGRDAAMRRVADACALDTTRLGPVRMTALDTARLGTCLREGAIAPAEWANWVVEQMRASTGGIGDVRGSDTAQHLAQQHSIVLDADRYRAGCLAVGAFWSAAVLVDYPAGRGQGYALTVCADTARTVFPPDMQQVPETLSPAPVTANA